MKNAATAETADVKDIQSAIINVIESVLPGAGRGVTYSVESGFDSGRPTKRLVYVLSVPQSRYRHLGRLMQKQLETDLDNCFPGRRNSRGLEYVDGDQTVLKASKEPWGRNTGFRIALANDEAGRPDEVVVDEAFIVDRLHPTAPLDAFMGIGMARETKAWVSIA